MLKVNDSMKVTLCCCTVILLLGSLSSGNSIRAQVSTVQTPEAKTPAPPPRGMFPVTPEATTVAPQVVTILHRLNGLKMFRLLIRSDKRLQAIDQLDEAFKIMGDVHTNVIAGLTMDDGQTIAAWLPEVEAELGPSQPVTPEAKAGAEASRKGQPVPAAKTFSTQIVSNDLFEAPDLTVVGRDGKKMIARYIGFDGATGLSILKLPDKSLFSASGPGDGTLLVGQHLRLLGPEPVSPVTTSGQVLVRVGETDGTIVNVIRAPSGSIGKLTMRSPKLSQTNIGGIVVDDRGQTIGIVDGVNGTEASILPTTLIQTAAKRVLEKQTSVPRPWLGVSGLPVANLRLDNLLTNGWSQPFASSLAGDRRGILLTSVTPGSPAAGAALRPGDIILSVNDEDIRSGDDFSWLLQEAGPGASVRFSVARPQQDLKAVQVQLSQAFDNAFAARAVDSKPFGDTEGMLIQQGIETVAVRPAVAARLGANGGLLVIYVKSDTEASKAGLRPGDVIQAINGQPVTLRLAAPEIEPTGETTLEVVRQRQKVTVRFTPGPPK